MVEGWYLMNTQELEQELRHWRSGQEGPGSGALPLTVEEALAYRNAGNLPDERGRTLRLVLIVDDRHDLERLASKRLRYEPDYHAAPAWRREGSRPVNVVPLHRGELAPASAAAWWDDPELEALEGEWRRTGMIGKLRVPADYRAFVFKTVLALRDAGIEPTADSVADSVSRWVAPAEAERIRRALAVMQPPGE